MLQTIDASVLDPIRAAVHPLAGTPADYDPLLELIGDARFVLLGEASHGTHEFYHARMQITQRLIRECGFDAVAAEADWPDAYRVNRYVRGASKDTSANQALGDFKRFPAWMWRNRDMVHFIDWLRAHNASRAAGSGAAGFYGLDLYSLHSSMAAVLRFLDTANADAARQARERYACFDRFGDDTQRYGLMTGIGGALSCREQVIDQLVELRRVAMDYLQRDGLTAEDEAFCAEQNARVVKDAEEYYRVMFHGDVSTWNLRDRHMMETLDALAAHLERQGRPARVVVWAHNSHLGDARATDMRRRGELNLGQLVRQRHGRTATLVGFTTDHGFVTAASEWDAPAERKAVRPALRGSYEALFHALKVSRFLLPLRRQGPLPDALAKTRLERAIGVIYLPATERASHYFHAELPRQFDAVLHFDETRALEPLERSAGWARGEEWDRGEERGHGEVPETYPSGM